MGLRDDLTKAQRAESERIQIEHPELLRRSHEILQAAYDEIMASPKPADDEWHRASWLYGAAYAIAWIQSMRGAEVTPTAAAAAFFSATTFVPPWHMWEESTGRGHARYYVGLISDERDTRLAVELYARGPAERVLQALNRRPWKPVARED